MNVVEVLDEKIKDFKCFAKEQIMRFFVIIYFISLLLFYLMICLKTNNIYLDLEKIFPFFMFTFCIAMLSSALFSCGLISFYKEKINKEQNIKIKFYDFLKYKVMRSGEFVTEDELDMVVKLHMEREMYKSLSECSYVGTDKNKIEDSVKQKEEIRLSYVNNTKEISIADAIENLINSGCCKEIK